MRKQIAFANLTEAEIDQIAGWLRNGTYQTVLERVRKPRADGGLSLDISRSPLERLLAKKTRVDKINSQLASGEKLTLAKFEAIEAGETPVSEKAHNAIMHATCELATSGENTPHQLLALQRLADFPARADYRDHKIEMDLHRKHIANEKLAIQKGYLALAEKAAKSKPDPAGEPQSDHLGPYAIDWDDVSERARIQMDLSKEEWARRDALHDLYDENGNLKEPQEANSAPVPLSDLDSQSENQLKENIIKAGSETQTLITDHSVTDHSVTDHPASLPGPENNQSSIIDQLCSARSLLFEDGASA